MTDQVLDAKSRVAHSADGWRTHITYGGREEGSINQVKHKHGQSNNMSEERAEHCTSALPSLAEEWQGVPEGVLQDQLRCWRFNLVRLFGTAPRTELRSLQPCVEARVGAGHRTLAVWHWHNTWYAGTHLSASAVCNSAFLRPPNHHPGKASLLNGWLDES